jgi:signal transduction histidine kinase
MIVRSRIYDRILTALITAFICTLVLVGMLSFGLLKQAQLRLANIFYVSQPISENVVIVALDDQSFSEYGRSVSLWSRSLYATLIDNLTEANARVVAFDIIFSESEAEDIEIVEALENARQKSQRPRFIMAAAGTYPIPIQSTLPDYPYGIDLDNVLQPNSTIRQAIDYIGFVDTYPDIDSYIRRQTSIIDYEGTLQTSFSLTAYLAYLRVPSSLFSQVLTAEPDKHLNIADQRRLRVDDYGFWMNNYFGAPNTFPTISFRDVIEGNYEPSFFEDKIVLVGLINNVGATDRYLVPSSTNGRMMAGVEIHAHAIETLLQNKAVRPSSHRGELIMIVLTTLITSIVAIYPRWYFKTLIWGVCVLLAVFITSFIFYEMRVVVNLLYLLLSLTIPTVLAIGFEITEEIRRRQRSEFLLKSLTQLEQQHLSLSKIWPLIAQDIRYIAPKAQGTIFAIQDGKLTETQVISPTSTSLLEIAQQAQMQKSIVTQQNAYAIPIIWQDNVHGVITLITKNQSSRRQVANLVKRIAPGIENALLHEEVRRYGEVQTELNQLKTQMIRMASHDLKNPLSRVIGYADLIQLDPSISQKTNQFVGYISDAGDEMLSIIEDILNLEQLRDGDFPKQPLDIVKLAREVYARYEPDFDHKSQTYEINTPQQPVMVNGHYRQISQVIANLLSNAHKYTPENGHITLNITLDEPAKKILIAVTDTGYGISEEAQKGLFKEFYRVRTSETANISGTGLGLSLVKSVVTAHDGRVWLDSKPKQGSTFFVELPII